MAKINYKKTIQSVLGSRLAELGFSYVNDNSRFYTFSRVYGDFKKDVIGLDFDKFYNPYNKARLQLIVSFRIWFFYYLDNPKSYKQAQFLPPEEIPSYDGSWVFGSDDEFRSSLELASKEIINRGMEWFEKVKLNCSNEDLQKSLGEYRIDLDRITK